MSSVSNILPFKGEVYLFPGLFSPDECNRLFNTLAGEVEWKQEAIRIFGKQMLQPRLTAWFADSLKSYTYSGLRMEAKPWNTELLIIKQKVEHVAGVTFNSALLNFYRDGNDSVGWHRDNEKELGREPVIASVSLGDTRVFQLRNHENKEKKISLHLENGSLLLMRGATQHNWEHRIPKTSKAAGGRINITFRQIS